MHGYRRAFSDRSLNMVDSFKYDNNFNNWIDPKVLKKFTSNIESITKSWKESYGFEFTNLLGWDGKNHNKQTGYSKCWLKCASMVGSS
jgi:hypothetical protein